MVTIRLALSMSILLIGAAVAGSPDTLQPSLPATADTPEVVRAVAPAYPQVAVDAVVLGYVVVEATIEDRKSVV